MSTRESISSAASAMGDELWCLFATYIPIIKMVEWPRALLSAAALAPAVSAVNPVPGPESASAVFDAFLSYSLEFVFFPDFAGNKSSPNKFSDNLLVNLGNLQGKRPHIRVGGNTQDYALYDESLPYAVNGSYDFDRSRDYPTTIHIGPSFFESYSTFPDTKFTHGFNLGLGGNRSEGWETLVATVPLACKAIGVDNLDVWEYGNEPDLFSTSAQGPVRPPSWNESIYVDQWLNGTREIASILAEACPEFPPPVFMAPSNAGTANRLRAPAQWAAGLNADDNIVLFSSHNYISGAESPGVTLQGTLMNHTKSVQSVQAHEREYANITSRFDDVPPQILGEHNSLYNQGKPGLSNSFGAALWGVDFNLYAATVGIKRVHLHMGTDYRYASWQPVDTETTSIGTKAPYYGNIAIAAFINPGSPSSDTISVAHVPLADDNERSSAYAAYQGSDLTRLLVINLEAYNSTIGGTGTSPDPDAPERPTFQYTFEVPWEDGTAKVQRLHANGSDAISGITWDGWSYNYELDEGKPVRLDNVTVGETVVIKDGQVQVGVAASEAVILSRTVGCSKFF
ncbi:glycoside hydrolase family 79 protein [Colletotrichum karsti]|uniref:Glycoside hydrolase family 79 protein n=1 Tax=Colletotrichum karsti TaxID=1095194 RepID=A0A9P6HT27_9PEZI|nr:glycoside hydrolase family 79 protein [Colletotrichum karsti]KAF9869619.1 glycoside hydrolase family 79 protein [Colletotrichum karsti]